LHINTLYGDNNHHIAESCFKATARALKEAVDHDPRQDGMVPSTKGTLSKAAVATAKAKPAKSKK
ncbi:MAG: hypothetical protein AAF213_06790, partial [Pseudomonadota bacterium]